MTEWDMVGLVEHGEKWTKAMQGEVTKQVRHFHLFSPLAVGERRLNRGPEALRDIEPKIQYNPNSEKPKAMNNNQGETAHPLKNTWFSLKHIFYKY